MPDRQYLEQLSRRLADDGRLIEAGWVAMRLYVVPRDASKAQLDDMRMSFMAGAEHLFASIMTMLDPGSEETPADLRRVDLISAELKAFRAELKARIAKPKPDAAP